MSIAVVIASPDNASMESDKSLLSFSALSSSLVIRFAAANRLLILNFHCFRPVAEPSKTGKPDRVSGSTSCCPNKSPSRNEEWATAMIEVVWRLTCLQQPVSESPLIARRAPACDGQGVAFEKSNKVCGAQW